MPFVLLLHGSGGSVVCSGYVLFGLNFRDLVLRPPAHHGYNPPYHLSCRPLNIPTGPGRTIEGVIAGGALSVFSAPLGPERNGCELGVSFDEQNHAGALVAGVVLEEMEGPITVDSCSRGGEFETAAGTCVTKQANQPAKSAPFASHPHHELEVVSSMGVANSRGGLDVLVDTPDTEFKDEIGDAGIAMADWLDVTHAMLGALDGPNSACR